MHADVRTMLHEAGHAFHSQLCRHDPMVHYRHSPIEFAEVASMSMELLSMPFWDELYPDEHDLARAKREQLEGVVGVLPWIATIDAYQQWLYTNPGHTREQRTAHWRTLMQRFGRAVSWDGLERHRDAMWRRQGHLFGSPFYYIEYGIAQLGALQMWLMAREQGLDAALTAYTRALSLGGSKPLPELFAAAGLAFDFSPPVVERLMAAVEAELASIPQ
jgi:oligoendopeptidase F